MLAAMAGRAAVVERLVSLPQLDINRRGLDGNTALSLAASQVHSISYLVNSTTQCSTRKSITCQICQ